MGHQRLGSFDGNRSKCLLVSLPFLVEQSAFDLTTWSVLIAIGSLLFLPSAPYWGRYSDTQGPKRVVVQSLIGVVVSFFLLYLCTLLSNDSAQLSACLIGAVIARIIYGLTASGMVPACQHWATLICGPENRLQAITIISVGLSTGRLIGPLIAVAALKLSPYAALMIMVALPLLALTIIALQPLPELDPNKVKTPTTLPWIPSKNFLPYLTSAIALCIGVALLQYSFTPLIHSITDWSASQVSDVIGILLSIGATCTLTVQLLVVKSHRMTPMKMYRLGALMFLVGFLLFLAPSIWFYGIAMAIMAGGAALIVPAYTSEATNQQHDAPGTVAGYIAMSHTIGYGLASLLAYTATMNPHYPVYIGIGSSLLIVGIAERLIKQSTNKPPNCS
ncbi:possible H+-antiporter [Vibrio maritimus]|uniref:Possible H+-antiporter n=1 Tax=Vibrio maritimus TaxID=990268 RepID=A0A090S5C3_9VIBR|nr:possible H+-antiporter [Vibrio maritimus]